jgi:hypothetical protein
MEETLLTYEDVLKATIGDKRFLLTGNGFSMSYNRERFSFTSLLDSAVENGLISEHSPIYDVFQEFATKDFEEVVKLLETSVRVLEKYSAISQSDKERIINDSKSLKNHLVQIITNNHPEKINEITDEEYLYSTAFINHYHKVYTLNYDLLLYWSTIKLIDFLQQDKIKEDALKPTDGFHDDQYEDKYVVFGNDSSPQEIYYLHGALHIFDKKDKIIKNTFSRTEIPLKEQTLQNMENDVYPVFVSEGTSEQKKAKIIHNAYLNHCYKSLSSIGSKNSSLIVFGTLLKTNDFHIREAILNNKVTNVYFGVGSDEEVLALQSFKDELSKARHSKNVYFYDYRTVSVWGK